MSATARVAEFAVKTSLEDCPPEALARVRLAALDTLGVMLAGAGEPAARAVRAVARAEGGTPLATVVGTRFVTSPGWAALANGTAGHAHDFDDTNFALMGHPSVPLLAGALAAGGAETAAGRALTLAHILGLAGSATPRAALNPEHYTRGWHATSTLRTPRRRPAARAVAGRARARLAAPRLGHRGQALPVVRPHPLGDRRAPRAARRARAGAPRRGRRRGRREPRRPRRPHPHTPDHSARAEVLDAVLRRGGARRGTRGPPLVRGRRGPEPRAACAHGARHAGRGSVAPGQARAARMESRRPAPRRRAHPDGGAARSARASRHPARARGAPRQVPRVRHARPAGRRSRGRRRAARAPRGHPRHSRAHLAARGRAGLSRFAWARSTGSRFSSWRGCRRRSSPGCCWPTWGRTS